MALGRNSKDYSRTGKMTGNWRQDLLLCDMPYQASSTACIKWCLTSLNLSRISPEGMASFRHLIRRTQQSATVSVPKRSGYRHRTHVLLNGRKRRSLLKNTPTHRTASICVGMLARCYSLFTQTNLMHSTRSAKRDLALVLLQNSTPSIIISRTDASGNRTRGGGGGGGEGGGNLIQS